MCIAAIAYYAHPRWLLVVAANRDELHDRPAAPLARWPNESIIAGRDLQSGGTWLGISEAQRRLVLVTNYRAPGYPQPDRPSRGALVTGLLTGADPATVALAGYNPCNLAVIDARGGYLLSNYPGVQRQVITPGIIGLSNGAIAAPWPKTRQLCADLAGWLAEDRTDTAPLLAALARESPPPSATASSAIWDQNGPDPEPRLSSVFIRNDTYGTRCSTLVVLDRHGQGHIFERRFTASGQITGETDFSFDWSV